MFISALIMYLEHHGFRHMESKLPLYIPLYKNVDHLQLLFGLLTKIECSVCSYQ